MFTSDAVWVVAWTAALAGVIVISVQSAWAFAHDLRDEPRTAARRHLVTSAVSLGVLGALAFLAPPMVF